MMIPPTNNLRYALIGAIAMPVAVVAANDVTIQNTTYTNTQTVQADNSITATPAVVVANGANITFHAGGRITLGPGFSVASGGLFRTILGASLPFTAGFETSEGYSLGSITNQLGWSVSAGSAEIVTGTYYSGTRSLTLQAGATPASTTHAFAKSANPQVAFVDLHLIPVAASAAASSSVVQTEAAKLGFQLATGKGEIYAFDGVGANQWVATGWRFDLNGSNQSAAWLHLTLRLDYGTKTWDLYANGEMVDYNLAFSSNAETYLRLLTLSGVASAPAFVDAVEARETNPLFTDADQDGMEDAWETTYGLNPAVNDRSSNLDGDSFSNIDEYYQRTAPNNADVTKPSIPGSFTNTASTSTSLQLSWSASTDTGAGTPGVAGYYLYRNGVKVNSAPINATSYTDTGLTPATTYSYTLRAADLAGNLSDPTSGINASTSTDSFEVFTPLP